MWDFVSFHFIFCIFQTPENYLLQNKQFISSPCLYFRHYFCINSFNWSLCGSISLKERIFYWEITYLRFLAGSVNEIPKDHHFLQPFLVVKISKYNQYTAPKLLSPAPPSTVDTVSHWVTQWPLSLEVQASLHQEDFLNIRVWWEVLPLKWASPR